MTKINKDTQAIGENVTQSPINEDESITDSNTTIQDSVESSTVNPNDTFISTDDSTTETLVEVDSANKTSNTKSKNTKAKTKSTKAVAPSFFTQRAKTTNSKLKYFFNETDYIEYYPTFSKSKKDALIVELMNTIDYCKNKGTDFLQDTNEIYKYTYYLIIKHFTSLYTTLSKWSVEDNIGYLNALYDSGDFELFFDEIFSFEEVQSVMDMLNAIEEMANLYAKDMTLRNKKIDETIQSDFLKDKLKSKELIN